MQIETSQMTELAGYKLLTGIIVPRPIAWVTTRSAAGVVNVAPFSAFMCLSYFPPMPAILCNRRSGQMKDTERNIREQKEFVVNIADESFVKQLHLSSFDYPPDVSEVAELGLELADCVDVATPRLAHVPASMECRLHDILQFGEIDHQFIIGKCTRFHIRDDLYENGKVDSAKLKPLGRLGGPKYTRLGEILTMPSVGSGGGG